MSVAHDLGSLVASFGRPQEASLEVQLILGALRGPQRGLRKPWRGELTVEQPQLPLLRTQSLAVAPVISVPKCTDLASLRHGAHVEIPVRVMKLRCVWERTSVTGFSFSFRSVFGSCHLNCQLLAFAECFEVTVCHICRNS